MLSVAQLEWLLAEFMPAWPETHRRAGRGRSTSAQNATDLLTGFLDRLSALPTLGAAGALDRLLARPADSHTPALRHAAAAQRQRRGEAAFVPTTPADLATMLHDGPPGDIDALHAIVLDVLDAVQTRLRGSDTDMAAPFWNGAKPWDENYCRDRLADLMTPLLEPYGIQRIPERYMPAGKRADLAFAHGTMQLPMEIKGQWHADVWDAASGQLDTLYLRDWRAGDRGVYIVLWFGNLRSDSGRRLKRPPAGDPPATPAAMAAMLVDRLPAGRRGAIAVRVIDLTR